MNYFKYICEKIVEGIMQKLSIAMLAISFWVINAEGMSSENLQNIMRQLGFTFNESTAILTVGETQYTINGLLTYCIEYVYPNERTLTAAALKCIIKKCENRGYITSTERTTLDNMLAI